MLGYRYYNDQLKIDGSVPSAQESVDCTSIAQQQTHSIADEMIRIDRNLNSNNTGTNNRPYCISTQLDEILMTISTSSTLLKEVQNRIESQHDMNHHANKNRNYGRRHSLESSYITSGERSSSVTLPPCCNAKQMILQSSSQMTSPQKQQGRRFSMPAVTMSFDSPPTPPVRTWCAAGQEDIKHPHQEEEITFSNDQTDNNIDALHSRILVTPSRLKEKTQSQSRSIRRIGLPGSSSSASESSQTTIESQQSRISVSSKLTELPRSKHINKTTMTMSQRRHSLEPNTAALVPPLTPLNQRISSLQRQQSRRFSMPTIIASNSTIMNCHNSPPTQPPIQSRCTVGEEIIHNHEEEISTTSINVNSDIEKSHYSSLPTDNMKAQSRILDLPSRFKEMSKSRSSNRRLSLPGLYSSSSESLETVLESKHSSISMSSKLTELPRSKQNMMSRRHSLEPNNAVILVPPSTNIRHIFDSSSVETIPLRNDRISLLQQPSMKEDRHSRVLVKPSKLTEMSQRSRPSIRRISLPGLSSSSVSSLDTVTESQHSHISKSSLKLTELPRSKQNKTIFMSRRHSLEPNNATPLTNRKIALLQQQSRRFSMPTITATETMMNFHNCPPTPPIRTRCAAEEENQYDDDVFEHEKENIASCTRRSLTTSLQTDNMEEAYQSRKRVLPSKLTERSQTHPSSRRISLPGLSSASSLQTVIESLSLSSKVTKLPRSKQNKTMTSRRHSLEPNAVVSPLTNKRMETIPFHRRMSLPNSIMNNNNVIGGSDDLSSSKRSRYQSDNQPRLPIRGFDPSIVNLPKVRGIIKSRCSTKDNYDDSIYYNEKGNYSSSSKNHRRMSMPHISSSPHSKSRVRRTSMPSLSQSSLSSSLCDNSLIGLLHRGNNMKASSNHSATTGISAFIPRNETNYNRMNHNQRYTLPNVCNHRRMSMPGLSSSSTPSSSFQPEYMVSEENCKNNVSRSRRRHMSMPLVQTQSCNTDGVISHHVLNHQGVSSNGSNWNDDPSNRRTNTPWSRSSASSLIRHNYSNKDYNNYSVIQRPRHHHDDDSYHPHHDDDNDDFNSCYDYDDYYSSEAPSNNNSVTVSSGAFTSNETNYNTINRNQQYSSSNVLCHRRMSMPGLSSSFPPSSSFQTDYMIPNKNNCFNNVSRSRRNMSMPLVQTQQSCKDGIISHHVLNHQANRSDWNEDYNYNNYDYIQRPRNNSHDNSYHPCDDDATYDISLDFDDDATSEDDEEDDYSSDEESEEEYSNDDDNDPSSIVNFPKVVRMESHYCTNNNKYNDIIYENKANNATSSRNHRRMSLPHLSSSSSYSHSRTRRASMSHMSSLSSSSICDQSPIFTIRQGKKDKKASSNIYSTTRASSAFTKNETKYRMNHHQRCSSSNASQRRMSLPGFSSSLPASSFQHDYMVSSDKNCFHNASCPRRRRMSMPALQTQKSFKDGIISHHVMNHNQVNRSNWNNDSNNREVNMPWSRSSASSLIRYDNYDSNKDNYHSVIWQRLRNNHDDSNRPSDDNHNGINSGDDDQIDEEYSTSEGIEEEILNDNEGNVTIHIDNKIDRQKQLLYPSSCKHKIQRKKIRLNRGPSSAATIQITISSHTAKKTKI